MKSSDESFDESFDVNDTTPLNVRPPVTEDADTGDAMRQLQMDILRASTVVTPEFFDNLKDFDQSAFAPDATHYPLDIDERTVDFSAAYEQLANSASMGLTLEDMELDSPIAHLQDEAAMRKAAAKELLSPYQRLKPHMTEVPLFGEVFVRDYVRYTAPSGVNLTAMVDTKGRIWFDVNKALSAFQIDVDDYLNDEFTEKGWVSYCIGKLHINNASLEKKVVAQDSFFMHDMAFNAFLIRHLAPEDIKWVVNVWLPRVRAQAQASMMYSNGSMQVLFDNAEKLLKDELKYKDTMLDVAKEIIDEQQDRLRKLQDYYQMVGREVEKMRTAFRKKIRQPKVRIVRYEPNIAYDSEGNPSVAPKGFMQANVKPVPATVDSPNLGVFEGVDLGDFVMDGKFISAIEGHIENFVSPYYDDNVILIDYLLSDLQVAHLGLNVKMLGKVLNAIGFERRARVNVCAVGKPGKVIQKTLYSRPTIKYPLPYIRERIESFGGREDADFDTRVHDERYAKHAPPPPPTPEVCVKPSYTALHTAPYGEDADEDAEDDGPDFYDEEIEEGDDFVPY